MNENNGKSRKNKHYAIGNVGQGARVAQGENITWLEAPSSEPEILELKKQFNALIQKISEDESVDNETKQLTLEKTKAVAESLGNAVKEPSKLKIALMDAKGWLKTASGWAWDSLVKIMKSKGAQKALKGITDTAVKAAITTLLF